MTYPDPPGPRIAYHRDGSIVLSYGEQRDESVVDIDGYALNSDGPSSYVPYWGTQWTGRPTGMVGVIFARRMKLEGVFVAAIGAWFTSDIFSNAYGTTARLRPILEVSTNTTNLVDGTWQQISDLNSLPRPDDFGSADYFNDSYSVRHNATADRARLAAVPEWRRRSAADDGGGWTRLNGSQVASVKAVRLRFNGVPDGTRATPAGGFNPGGGGIAGVTLHLYGEPAALATGGELRFRNSGDDNDHDFGIGDVHAGQTVVQTFRLANLSTTLAADDITISSYPANPDTLPSPSAGIQFSTDGSTYGPSIQLDTLGAGQSTADLYVRMVVPEGLAGPYSPQISAIPQDWS